MPRENELLATPPNQWHSHPKIAVRREIYSEGDDNDEVRWEVYVSPNRVGHPDRFRFVLFTEQYDRLVGVGHAEMSGKTVFEACTERDAVKISYQYESAVQEFGEYQSKGLDHIPFRYPEFLEIGGKWRWWRTTLKPVRGDDNRLWKLIGSSQQVSSMEADLRDAIYHRRLAVHYQPICELSERCINCTAHECSPSCLVGYEALIRWPGSGYGPGDFLPLAKAAGLMEEITDFVIHQVAQRLKKLDERLWISINVSNYLFESTLEREVAVAGVDPVRLRLEITEDTDLTPITLARFRYVRYIGHLIELDDFGADRANFGWIKSTGAIAIKIDRQFVTGAHSQPNKAHICRSVINFAKHYNPPLEVIVEGVESREDMRFMTSLGADMGQGWLFGKPDLLE